MKVYKTWFLHQRGYYCVHTQCNDAYLFIILFSEKKKRNRTKPSKFKAAPSAYAPISWVGDMSPRETADGPQAHEKN